MEEFCMDLANMKIQKPNFLPHDVIETNILSRLPVKSLVRFKSVCKQWLATISDPFFVNSHLQLQVSKISEICSSFFIPSTVADLRRVEFKNHQLRELPPLQFPMQLQEDSPGCVSRLWDRHWRKWCYCDGLFLALYPKYRAGYVVWNPSRRMHKELFYPYPVDNFNKSPPKIGIYYLSLVKDYKVVVVGDEHNAVFSCKNNSWSEMRTNAITFDNIPGISFEQDSVGVAYKESIYWIWRTLGLGELDGTYTCQVVCFDGKDEMLKVARNIDPSPFAKQIFSSPDGLYVICHYLHDREPTITKILPVWMQYEVDLPFPFMTPVCFTPQDKVIFICVYEDTNCVLFDHTRNQTTILHSSFDFGWSCYQLFPCIQALFSL